MARRGIDFHPVIGMGSGPLLEVAARARAFVEDHPVWKDPRTPVHFLAHSAGGLVARLVADALGSARPNKIQSCLTVASPHRGSRLAQVFMEMHENYRGSALILKSFGYDVSRKRPYFSELTPAAVKALMSDGDNSATESGVARASIVAWAPREEWCLPLSLFYRLRAFNDFRAPSDGVVERDTQTFGQVVAELKIDHFRQIGLFGESHRFEQLCDVAERWFKKGK